MARDSDEAREILSASWRKIYDVVMRIPRGKVMTYGDVAAAAGLRGAARLVGYAMRGLGARVPWHRVLGKRRSGVAQVSIKDPLVGTEQRLRLEREQVRFSASGGVDLARYGHRTQDKASRARNPRAEKRSQPLHARSKPRA